LKILDLNQNEIERAIKDGNVTICVFGAGKLGLPVALAFVDAGANVICVDSNQNIVDLINKGENPYPFEPYVSDILKKAIKEKKISASTDAIESAKNSDVIIILIPTITNQNNELDNSPLEDSLTSIGKGLSNGQIIILESTIPPGTTENYIKNKLEQVSGLKVNKDFGLSHSPERVMSGSILDDLRKKYPKIVSGMDEKTIKAVAALYNIISEKGVLTVSNVKTAEAVKVFEGIYRDVNIALANEFAKIAEKLGIDILEIINAANSQPYSHIHLPSAGVGGHCIPVYPHFILNLDEFNNKIEPKMIRLARSINDSMPLYTINLAKIALEENKKTISEAKISLLGLTFRGGIKETRNVPAFKMIKYFMENKIDFKLFDPLLSSEEINTIFGRKGENSLENACKQQDVIIFLTDHKEFKNLDLKKITSWMNEKGILIDGKQIFQPKDVIEAGLFYKGIGRLGEK